MSLVAAGFANGLVRLAPIAGFLLRERLVAFKSGLVRDRWRHGCGLRGVWPGFLCTGAAGERAGKRQQHHFCHRAPDVGYARTERAITRRVNAPRLVQTSESERRAVELFGQESRRGDTRRRDGAIRSGRRQEDLEHRRDRGRRATGDARPAMRVLIVLAGGVLMCRTVMLVSGVVRQRGGSIVVPERHAKPGAGRCHALDGDRKGDREGKQQAEKASLHQQEF